jgi:thioesterase domain-containing protein
VTPSDLQEAERFFHERIPLTRAMGVRVVSNTAGDFAVEAPVALNHNHLDTAFGGSINAIATLAGYARLWLAIRDQHAHLVVAQSSIRFLRPIRETIRAICEKPEADRLASFKAALRQNGKSRLKLSVTVQENSRTAAEFTGTFVALRE